MRLKDLTGERFGALVVVSRAENATLSSGRTRVRWVAMCDCGQAAVVRGTQLRSGRTTSCGCRKFSGGGRPHSAVVSYGRAHRRIAEEIGPAASYPCSDCQERSAADWSYQGGCPDEMESRNGHPYCLHAHHYVPRCKGCHVKRDRVRDEFGRLLPKFDKADRLAYASAIVDREVTTSAELTDAEAEQIIRALESIAADANQGQS